MFHHGPDPHQGRPDSSLSIPAVKPEDMRSVWPVFEMVWQGELSAGATGIDVKLLAQHCSPGADINAISFRVAVVKALLHQGLLDAWKDGETPRPVVFEVIAKCPIEPVEGRLRFDPEAILAAIKLAG